MAENWYVVLLAAALIFGLVRCYRRIRFAPAQREAGGIFWLTWAYWPPESL
ncbi:MAG: hypothetical protein ACLR76_07090 [Alistipes sp.]